MMHFDFVAQSGAVATAVTLKPNGQPIMYPPVTGRRHSVEPPESGGGGPRIITLDGQDGDWNGLAPLVSGAASLGTSNFKFQSIFAFAAGGNLFFKFDVFVDTTSQPPVATNDTYGVRQGHTLNVSAPGVLANDTDPAGLPLTAAVLTNPGS